MTTPSALAGIRVLDLATPAAEIAGRVFADLGAEVIKIEPPGGCASRRTPPFDLGKEGDPEGSLYWRAFGLGKKSVVLDLERADERARFLGLVRGADVLIESFTPGTLDALGLGYEALRRENESLLHVSVTPFGQSGPDAKSPASDLTLAAAGGLLNMQGDRDRPPVPIGWPETSHHGAVQAAADAILALWERRRTGLGQQLDSSMQAAVVWTLLFATGHSTLYGEDTPGWGAKRSEPPPQLLPGLVDPEHGALQGRLRGDDARARRSGRAQPRQPDALRRASTTRSTPTSRNATGAPGSSSSAAASSRRPTSRAASLSSSPSSARAPRPSCTSAR